MIDQDSIEELIQKLDDAVIELKRVMDDAVKELNTED